MMMTDTTEDPTRSCVGCRQKDARDVLLRFVAIAAPEASVAAPAGSAPPRVLVPDVRRRANGRGVSVHPRQRCLRAAVQNGAFRRAFRGAVEPSLTELVEGARMQYERRAQGLLLAARRAGKLALGTEAARDAIAARKAQLLLIAHDAEGRREELEEAARRLGRAALVWNSKQGLGHIFSRPTLSILAVLDGGIADEIRSVVRSAAELAEDS